MSTSSLTSLLRDAYDAAVAEGRDDLAESLSTLVVQVEDEAPQPLKE